MSLAPGARLGPCEVLGPLGSGGPAYVRGWIVPRELRRGLVRLRLEAAPAGPRRSSARLETERRWAEAQQVTQS